VRQVPDGSRNGLQVPASREVGKVGFAVDASLAVFERAHRLGCGLVVVHHGIRWKGLRDSLGNVRRRIEFLRRRGMGLYAAHLPLDLHPRYGNNIELARILGLVEVERFGRYKGRFIGYRGRFDRPRSIGSVALRLRGAIGGRPVKLAFGRSRIRTVGIVSGGGADALAEAVRKGLDLFITGEAPHHVYHDARDARMNVMVAGHYETETVGVKALMPLLRERFGVKTAFIDVSTPF